MTIADDEGMKPQLALVLTPPRVREGLVSTVTAVASGALDDEATIRVTVTPDADTRTDDYVLSANTELTIPAGETRSSGSRRRMATVSGTVTGGGVANPADQTLTILEDDRSLLVHLSATPGTIAEGESSAITLRSAQPAPADLTVSVEQMTPTDAVRLSSQPVLMIAKGETASTGVVTLTAVDDADTSNEVVRLRGTPSTDTPFARVTSLAEVYIFDDDAGQRLLLSPVPTQIPEGGTIRIIANLSQPLPHDVTVEVAIDEDNPNHTAASDEYTVSAARTLTIPAGSMRSTGEVTITASDDEYYGPLGLGRVAIKLASVTGIDESLVVKHSDVTIHEHEAVPEVTLEVTPASIGENGGRSTVTASLNTIVEGTVQVTVSTHPVGTAQASDQ